MIWVAGFKGEAESTRPPPSQDSPPMEGEDPQESGIGVIPAETSSQEITEAREGECTMALPPGGFVLVGTGPHPPHSSPIDLPPPISPGFSNQIKPPALPEKKAHSFPQPECPSPGVPGDQQPDHRHLQLPPDLADLSSLPGFWESWVGVLGTGPGSPQSEATGGYQSMKGGGLLFIHLRELTWTTHSIILPGCWTYTLGTVAWPKFFWPRGTRW